ncbi:MAG: hypothetical protein HWE24_02225 [Oceanospirillaceae bacterium]|nr:hypothetical protein [Oceanospirillaceae bacterium]
MKYVLLILTIVGAMQCYSDIEIVRGETVADESSIKQLTLHCPPGHKVVGSGWSALDPTNAILDGMINYSQPSYDGSSWTFNASNHSSYSTQWKLNSSISCMEQEKLDSDYIITGETELNRAKVKQFKLNCPVGKKVVSAGWAALDGSGSIIEGQVGYSMPDFRGEGWTVNVENTSAYTSLWRLQLKVICLE